MNKVKILLGAIFLPLGLVLAGTGIWFYLDGEELERIGVRTAGQVIDQSRNRDSDGDITYHPVIAFTDRSGQIQRFVSNVSTSPPSHYIGEDVTIIYDPEDPSHAVIDSFAERSLLPLIFGGVGTLFAVIGAGLLISWFRRWKIIKHLRRNGLPLMAKFTECYRDTSTKINSRSPWKVACQAVHPATGKLQRFESEALWVYPGDILAGKELRVLYDPNNPTHYFVDLSPWIDGT